MNRLAAVERSDEAEKTDRFQTKFSLIVLLSYCLFFFWRDSDLRMMFEVLYHRRCPAGRLHVHVGESVDSLINHSGQHVELVGAEQLRVEDSLHVASSEGPAIEGNRDGVGGA